MTALAETLWGVGSTKTAEDNMPESMYDQECEDALLWDDLLLRLSLTDELTAIREELSAAIAWASAN
jgi:hypothetical protein